MKKTLLFALALIASGCADARQSALCEGLPEGSPLEAVRTCAEQGYAYAQNNLGVMYQGGTGVQEDAAEAARWFRLAAEQGDAPAQVVLGVMYAAGEGVPRDNVLAYMWFNLSAAQENSDAPEVKNLIEEQMTREQIAEGQRLSTEWLETHPPGGN